jgi:hypothetical protein
VGIGFSPDKASAGLGTQVRCALMSSRERIRDFWTAMQANDWDQAATCLAPDCVIDWPCTGERIVGRPAGLRSHPGANLAEPGAGALMCILSSPGMTPS